MATYVLMDHRTGEFLRADFSTTPFLDAERVNDANEATWLESSDDDDAATLTAAQEKPSSRDIDVMTLDEAEARHAQ